MKMILQNLRCSKCEYEWIPRVAHPLKCPRCGTRDWSIDQEKKEEVVITD